MFLETSLGRDLSTHLSFTHPYILVLRYYHIPMFKSPSAARQLSGKSLVKHLYVYYCSFQYMGTLRKEYLGY